jgi:hypothetical protein
VPCHIWSLPGMETRQKTALETSLRKDIGAAVDTAFACAARAATLDEAKV